MADNIKVGDLVYTNARTEFHGKVTLQSWVNTTVRVVTQVGSIYHGNDYIVIGDPKTKETTAAVHRNTITLVNKNPTPTKTPQISAKDVKQPETMPSNADIIKNAQNRMKNGDNIGNYTSGHLDDNAVMTTTERLQAQLEIARETEIAELISKDNPLYVQNEYGFPPVKNIKNREFIYNYYMDYDKAIHEKDKPLTKSIKNIKKSLSLIDDGGNALHDRYIRYYNKYKLNFGDDMLSKSFAHIFFIRPNCNIFTGNGGGLVKPLDTLSEFYYAFKHCPNLLKQLTQTNNSLQNHEFMMFLSNKIRSFDVSPEFIESDTYGEAKTGYKVPYGKHNVSSRTAGKFSISYIDDRNLHVYHLHKIWIDYISYVYRGKIYPRKEDILNKILDYPTCVYYILCAEDGETVIFWTKYWGVFPLDAPSNVFGYNAENVGGLKLPEYQIEYSYAWKEDFNPLTLIEFNEHSKNPFRYIDNYQSSKLGTGITWANEPFIETFNGNGDIPYTFKLRFRPNDIYGDSSWRR